MLGSPALDAGVAGVFGLLVGSFLNVVIYRLPVRMMREWITDSVGLFVPSGDGQPTLWSQVFGTGKAAPAQLEAGAVEAKAALDELPPLTLSRPRSRCNHCGHLIAWYENIPVLSYLVLRGRCSACQARISPRYPVIELVTGAFFALCAWRWGLSLTAAFWAAFAALLICQFMIDLDTQYLPDSLNYMLLWLGLLGSVLGIVRVPLSSAVMGAILGYLVLWLVYHAYRLATGKEGMGYGDFKLLAALGAWLGAQYLIAIVLLSSVVGAVLGGFLLVSGRLAHKDIPISFGPFLAGAGLLCLLIGPQAVPDLIPFAFPLGGP